jgi:hypothetical protein
MSLAQEATSATGLDPPRPNLGPEPWPEAPTGPGVWAWAGLTLVVAALGWRMLRKRTPGPTPQGQASPIPTEPERSPSQRLVESSEAVRVALIGAFGPSWGSKTTEEIAADPALAGRLDPAEVDRLIELLLQADRVKFGSAEPDEAGDWEAWALGFASVLAAGATSRNIGK